MCVACTAKDVERRLPLGLVLERVLMDGVNIHERFLFHDTLVDNLAKVSNPEACICAGLHDIFGANHDLLNPCIDMLKTATDAGHKPTAYMLALFLYRRKNGASGDDEAMWLIRQVEGEEDDATVAAMATDGGEGTPTPWKNIGCMRCCKETLPIAGGVLPPLYVDDRGFVIDDVPFVKPVVRGTLLCAGN
ncbi:hypothetical protein HU200_063639 [Digitaria exilis]|uniref:Uncharacterized protein n=1 Tax=Digitaria exilis TaxID=1010633 RepID=A0A835A5K1_9POAL|nr:hypothetical protein HU200_063639 [Digitaria exilis]